MHSQSAATLTYRNLADVHEQSRLQEYIQTPQNFEKVPLGLPTDRVDKSQYCQQWQHNFDTTGQQTRYSQQ